MNNRSKNPPFAQFNVFSVDFVPKSARTIELVFFGRWHIWFVCWIDIWGKRALPQSRSK